MFNRLARERDAAAREMLVERFLPLARHMARRYGRAEDMDDLVQIASIGLLKAIDRFDPDRGLAFISFAFPTIAGELKRHFRDRGWSVRVPRGLQELVMRIERLSGELVSELGRAPTVAELAERADATSEQVLEALQAATAHHALSLDHSRADADEPQATGRELAVDEPGYGAVEDAAMLDGLLRFLPERDREILTLRFRDDLLQWQIAEIMGISQMHVSRVIGSSIERLQRAAATNPAARTDASPRYGKPARGPAVVTGKRGAQPPARGLLPNPLRADDRLTTPRPSAAPRPSARVAPITPATSS